VLCDVLLWGSVCHHVKREASRFIHLRASTPEEAANIRPYTPFVNGLDPEGEMTLIETRPCTRCNPPRFGLGEILYGLPSSGQVCDQRNTDL
jgi:hypothetical protein